MGEVTVGIRFSQQQRSGRANDRGRSSNAVANDRKSWGLRQQPRFPSTLTPTPRKRWNNLQIPQRIWNNLWTHPKTWMRTAPMFPVNMWISIFIMAFTINGIQTLATPEFRVLHQFTAYDCKRPLSVDALQLPSHCLDHKTNDDTTDPQTNLTMTDNKSYQLLQKATYHEFDAYMCKQSRSRFFYSCMWASHSIV